MQSNSRIKVASKSLLLISLVLMGCHRVKPQAPANQQTADELTDEAQMINLRLADAADQAITEWVSRADTAFVHEDYGYWFTIRHGQPADTIHDQDRVEIFYRTTTLSGELIEDVQQELTVGKRESLWAIDHVLPLMAETDRAIIASPYYTAYGRDGNERVEPLTNCIIEINSVRIIR